MRKKATKKAARNDTSTKAKKVAVKKTRAARKGAAPKTRNDGHFTESMFWNFIRAALRNKSRWWKPRLKVLEEARRPNQSANKRLKWEFQCSHCKDWFPQTQVEVNHKIPAGTLTCAADLSGFVEKLFCEKGDLEVVCKKCHAIHHGK